MTDFVAATVRGETKHLDCLTDDEKLMTLAFYWTAENAPDKFCPECGRKIRKAVKRMPIAEFRKLGYLHELNRVFLHPLGLALEVVVEENGDELLGGVWDYRDEGLTYSDGLLRPDAVEHIAREWAVQSLRRLGGLGFVTQPVPGVLGLECHPQKVPS